MPIATTNPATGELIRVFDPNSSAEVDAKIQKAHDAFRAHRRTPFADRAAKMRKAGDILEAEKDRWARIMTLEMGKTLKSAGDEALKCAWACRFYADKAEKFLATANSPAVDAKMRAADTQIIAMHVPGTPCIVVNGKYRINMDSLQNQSELFDLVSYLVAKETKH